MADLSPELASRIQALEASYADNPGRYFVALAGAWREAGDVARAEEILRENLKRFPGLSAHVLLGRCLADRGAFQEAANEFHYVLSIDAQNLIALRTLAEMAAAGGRRVEAERWYNELLAVDPMNAEARSALAHLARAADAAPTPPPQQAGAAPEREEFGMIDLSTSGASPADASGAADGTAADGADAGEWGDLTLEEEAAAAARPAGEPGHDFDAFGFGSVDLDAQAPAPAGWEEARQDVGASAAADADSPPLDDAFSDDALLDAPLAGADLPLLNADEDDAGPGDDDLLSAVSQPGAGFGFGEPAGSFDDGGPVAHEQDGHDVDAEMVTETMAELYASQGLHAQAADVYRELIARRGPEPGLVQRLDAIEAGMRAAGPDGSLEEGAPAEPAPDWLESVDAFARGGGEPPPSGAVPADLPELELATGWESAPPAKAEPSAAPAGEPADSFAGSFAAGFAGAGAPEETSSGGHRQAWEAPAVAETEPVGFDILVVEDETGAEVPASPEVVADVSADWAIAAAPLGDGEEEAGAAPASTPEAAPAEAAARTMRGYFDALLAWRPGQAAVPAYEASAEEGTIVITPAHPSDDATAPPLPDAPAPPFGTAPEPFAPAAGLEPEGPGAGEDAPWGAAPEDEPWAASGPGESVPQAAPVPAPEALPMLELEEPWVEAPAAPQPPGEADGAEEQLPWEVPAEPAPEAPGASAPAGGGFSFEDFFSGGAADSPPADVAEPAPEPEPVPEPQAEPEAPGLTAFTPSFTEPAPAPAAPASAAPAADEPAEGEDEDLESFQAWLQSLKR